MIVLVESNSNITELTVKVGTDLLKFEIEDLNISSNDISYEDVICTGTDKKFQNWAGQSADDEDLLYQILNAYLRNDYTDFEFVDGWSVFDTIKKLAKTENGVIISLPQIGWSGLMMYSCDLATETDRFYYADDYCMLLDNENAIVTDIEEFYVEAFDEECAAILKGEKEPLYTGYNYDLYVEENRDYLMEL